jgi:hypothetical protein
MAVRQRAARVPVRLRRLAANSRGRGGRAARIGGRGGGFGRSARPTVRGSRPGARSARPSQRRPTRRRPILGHGFVGSLLRVLGIAYLVNVLFGWGPGGSPLGLLIVFGVILWLVMRPRRGRPLYS